MSLMMGSVSSSFRVSAAGRAEGAAADGGAGFVATGVKVGGTVYSGLLREAPPAEADVAVASGAVVRGGIRPEGDLLKAMPPKALAPGAPNMDPADGVALDGAPNPPNPVEVGGAAKESGSGGGAAPKVSCEPEPALAAGLAKENMDCGFSLAGAGVDVTVFGVKAKEKSEEALTAGALDGGLAVSVGCCCCC